MVSKEISIDNLDYDYLAEVTTQWLIEQLWNDRGVDVSRRSLIEHYHIIKAARILVGMIDIKLLELQREAERDLGKDFPRHDFEHGGGPPSSPGAGDLGISVTTLEEFDSELSRRYEEFVRTLKELEERKEELDMQKRRMDDRERYLDERERKLDKREQELNKREEEINRKYEEVKRAKNENSLDINKEKEAGDDIQPSL